MASDGDIHFPPGQRRDKPTFEPPPWEQDRFEELARQKREAELVAAQAEPATTSVEAEQAAVPLAPLVSELVEVVHAGADEERATGESEKPELDPKHVEVLMMGLRSEEPRPEEAYWRISIAAGIISALIGLVVTTWGVIAVATPKQGGASSLLLVTMLLFFGLGFIVGGVWVVFRSLRQRGVL